MVVAISVAFSSSVELWLDGDQSPFARMRGARQIAAEVRQQATKTGYHTVLVDNRRLAALMHYYLRDSRLEVMSWRGSAIARDHFELTGAFQDRPADQALLATPDTNPAAIVASFAHAELLGDIEPAGLVARKVWFYALSGYRPELSSESTGNVGR
jgi:hypothetical protein